MAREMIALRLRILSGAALVMVTVATPFAGMELNDVNILVTTDTHSWIAGHSHADHAPLLTADYGDVLSLRTHLAERCRSEGKDLFFVNNGDINDGTGLSAAPPATLVPLLERMGWDALTIGNHELYRNDTIDFLSASGGWLDAWGDRFLTANVLRSDTHEPLSGHRCKILEGEFGARLLTFGFLYNMDDTDSMVEVERVEEAVRQAWFEDALRDEAGFDAVLVLAHMHFEDPLVFVLLQAIRSIVGEDMPVQFITGHSHQRHFLALDAHAASLEAGHYLDTVGFASFPLPRLQNPLLRGGLAKGFGHEFIDGNVDVFKELADQKDGFDTEAAMELKQAIAESQEALKLGEVIGCAESTYRVAVNTSSPDSLWALWLDHVVPDSVFHGESTKVMIASTGTLRYDLFVGPINKNDLITMSPFANKYLQVMKGIPGADLAKLIAALNEDAVKDAAAGAASARDALKASDGDVDLSSETLRKRPALRKFLRKSENFLGETAKVLNYGATPFETTADQTYDLYTLSFDVGKVANAVENLLGVDTDPVELSVDEFGDSTTSWFDFVSEHMSCTRTSLEREDAKVA